MSDADLIERYATWKRYNDGAAPSTVAHYVAHVRRLAAHLSKPLSRATPDELEAWSGPELHRQGLKPNGRRNAIAALRDFYAYLLRHGVVQTSPAAGLSYPKSGRSLPVAMPLQHAEALMWAPDLDTFKGVRDSAMLSVLLGCGLRVSGLVALDEQDLWFTEDKKGEHLILRIREKGDHERMVPAPSVTRLAVRAYLGHRELDTIDRRTPEGNKVLFVSLGNRMVPQHEYHGESRRLSVWAVQEMIRRYADQAKIPEQFAHPHALRHLFGQELAEADVDSIIRQKLLGHADPKSTEIYSHIAFRKLRRDLEKSSPFQRIKTPLSDLVEQLG